MLEVPADPAATGSRNSWIHVDKVKKKINYDNKWGVAYEKMVFLKRWKKVVFLMMGRIF